MKIYELLQSNDLSNFMLAHQLMHNMSFDEIKYQMMCVHVLFHRKITHSELGYLSCDNFIIGRLQMRKFDVKYRTLIANAHLKNLPLLTSNNIIISSTVGQPLKKHLK